MMRRILLVWCALAAGCLDAAPQALTEDPPAPDVVAGLRYVCDEIVGERRGDGLCVVRLASRQESFQEPVLAVHPRDPATLVVAVILGETTGSATDAPLLSPSPARLALLVSEDAGASWRLARVPLVEVPSALGPVTFVGTGDPSIVLDESGTLHLAGMITGTASVRGSQIFHMSSPDLGETWSSPTILADDTDNDREWIAMPRPGLLVVTWQNLGSSIEYAWSEDGGASWRAQDPATRPGQCGTVSPAVQAGAALLVACAGYQGNADAGLQVHALDLATGGMTLRAEIASMPARWPNLLRGGERALVLVADDHERETVLAAVSRDEGATWSTPADLREWLRSEDAWVSAQTYAAATDADGDLHVLLKGSKRVVDAAVGRAHLEPSLLHAAVNVSDGRVLLEREVWPALQRAPAVPESAAPSWSDDFGSIAFTRERAFLAWGWEKGIDVAAVEDSGSPPPDAQK